ncbi:acyltransferase family protein [Dryocola sp. BD613]|uniref:acyltransferase family protein n=1 Tax=Dryocola sp. BD613 TaxID=3133272 RepID=UPI003F4F5B07
MTYRPDVQGLRAIAVLAVIVFHYNPAWLPGGFVGVDIFFVLSGFLITSILIDKKQKADYQLLNAIQYFYLSRIKRIFPAYFFMLVFIGVFTAIVFLPSDFTEFLVGLKKAIWFNSNSYFSTFGDYFSPATHEQPLLHTWSLAVEIQFYLIIPFLILLLPVRILKVVLWAFFIVFIILAEYQLRAVGAEQATYYSLAARLPEFFAGSLTALYLISTKQKPFVKKQLNCVGLFLVIMAVFLQPMLGPFPGIASLFPVLGVILILFCVKKSYVNHFLSHPWLVWIGALSYSLYLWHWPVLALLRYCSGTYILNSSFSFLFIILTVTISWFSYYLIEVPYRTEFTIRKGFLAGAVLVGGTSILMPVAKYINQIFTPPKLSIEYQRYADPATICHGQIVKECLRGDLTSKHEVLVLGDSHAAMLNKFFDYLGKELGFRARVITASSCVTIPSFDYQRLPYWAQKSCINQIEIARKFYDKSQFIILAGAWNYQFSSKKFPHVLSLFLDDIQQKRKKIVILTQVPLLNTSPLRNQRLQYIGIPSQAGINKDYIRTNEDLRTIVSKYSNAKIIDLSSLSLFMKAPTYNGELMYFDNSHLNEIGSKLYAEKAKPFFARIINND